MAHYNTTIWIVTMLVIVRLSSTMHGDDRKDSLTKPLLGEFETGSSSVEPTDTVTDLSKQKLIDEYNYLQTLNRGIFTSAQINLTESDTVDKVRDTLFNTIKELDCNYMYDMLVFMKLMTPENYTSNELYVKVDSACSNWAKHMLNARINSGFPSRDIPHILWVFYFYAKKMKMFALREAKKEMNRLQKYIEIHFEEQTGKCQFLWFTRNRYGSYMEELNRLSENLALEKTIEACTRLGMMSESKDYLNLDFDTSLYINNVAEDRVIMKTLITSFGGLDGGPTLVKLLNKSTITAKNPTISLSRWIHSLKNVHYYFLRIVKTIMLRLLCATLENSIAIENSQSAQQVEKLLYNQHLNDFVSLFKLNDDDHFIKLVKNYLNGDPIGEKVFEIISLLRHYDTEKPQLQFWNHNSEALEAINCQTSTLVNIANGIGYKIDNIQSSIRESILCAEVFVEYLKKILNGVNFNILQSFYVSYDKFETCELIN